MNFTNKQDGDFAVYQAPEMDIRVLGSESVLCTSTGRGNQDYGYGSTDNWY
ncbi:MAG: hypothetical protein MJY60_01610 [Bacteroidales bacterium]|nr:hypothetical protein [Bacteroidales bacterium]